MTEQIIRPGELVNDANAPFKIMKAAMLALFGESYVNRVLEVNKVGFGKRGIFGWCPNDANIVTDVTPMPDPWRGQWGYRLRFCAWDSNGDIVINEFYVPNSVLPQFHAGNLSEMTH